MTHGRTLLGATLTDYPFMNFFKNGSGPTTNDPTNVSAAGYPIAQPTTNYSMNPVRYPASLATSGVHWVLKWTGAGAIRCLSQRSTNFTIHSDPGSVLDTGQSNFTCRGADGRIEFSFNDNPTSQTWVFPGSYGTYSNMSGLILCRASDEAALDAAIASGLIENQLLPEWVSRMQELNIGIFRPMGWVDPNDGCNAAQWAYRAQSDYICWTSVFEKFASGAWVGNLSGTTNYTASAASDGGTLVNRRTIQGKVVNASVGNATLDYNGTGAKKVFDNIGYVHSPLSANTVYSFVYGEELDGGAGAWIARAGGLFSTMPLEAMVAVCNRLGCDFWYTFPHLCTDEFVEEATAYIRDNLSSGLSAYFEYSNEIWNTVMAQTTFARRWAATLGLATDNGRNVHGPYGLRVRQIMEIVTDAWGARSGLLRVAAFQLFGDNGTNGSTDRYRFKGEDLGSFGYNVAPNRPIDWVDVISPATYWEGAQFQAFHGSTATDSPWIVTQSAKTITSIAQASPAVVTTSAAHGYVNGQRVWITSVGGMTQVNNLAFTAANVTATIYELQGIDSTGYGSYTSGGQSRGIVPGAIQDLIDAADAYDAGDTETALEFMYDDAAAGTRLNASGVPTVGAETLLGLKTDRYPLVQALAELHGKLVRPYEGGAQWSPPSTTDMTIQGYSAAYVTILTDMLADFKRSGHFRSLTRRSFDEFMDFANFDHPAWLQGPGSGVAQFALVGSNLIEFDEFMSWDATVEWNNEETEEVSGGGSFLSPESLAAFRDNHERLKEAEQRRSKNKREHQARLRDAVEELYDKLAGIAPDAAAKIAAVIPAKAKVTETAAISDSETPAIDWSKVTAAQIAKVIATLDAYAAQLEAEQRQQAIARADAARHQDEDDVESLLMSFP